MTRVQSAIRPKLGRFYASSEEAGELLANNARALEASETAVLGLWGAKMVVPSLTTLIGLGRGLVMRNTAVQGEDKVAQMEYLEAVKELQRFEQEEIPSESLKSAMQIGTAVHLLAELRHNFLLQPDTKTDHDNHKSNPTPIQLPENDESLWRQLESEALAQEGKSIPWRSLHGFYAYSKALRGYFKDNPEVLEPEVRVLQERWCGTADGIGENALVDYKTGRRLALIQNFVQIIALAETTGKEVAELVWLRQNGSFKSVKVLKGSSLWEKTMRAFWTCLRATERVLEERLRLAQPESFLLSEEEGAEIGQEEFLLPHEVTSVIRSGSAYLAQERYIPTKTPKAAVDPKESLLEGVPVKKPINTGMTSTINDFLPTW